MTTALWLQLGLLIAFTGMVICLVQQIRMRRKKQSVNEDQVDWYAQWSKYHNLYYLYYAIGIPFSLATGVLFAHVLPIWVS